MSQVDFARRLSVSHAHPPAADIIGITNMRVFTSFLTLRCCCCCCWWWSFHRCCSLYITTGQLEHAITNELHHSQITQLVYEAMA